MTLKRKQKVNWWDLLVVCVAKWCTMMVQMIPMMVAGTMIPTNEDQNSQTFYRWGNELNCIRLQQDFHSIKRTTFNFNSHLPGARGWIISAEYFMCASSRGNQHVIFLVIGSYIGLPAQWIRWLQIKRQWSGWKKQQHDVVLFIHLGNWSGWKYIRTFITPIIKKNINHCHH